MHVIDTVIEVSIEAGGRRGKDASSYWMTLREGENAVN
jgi:hypothetical protein